MDNLHGLYLPKERKENLTSKFFSFLRRDGDEREERKEPIKEPKPTLSSFTYHSFLETMKGNEYVPVVKMIKSFVRNVTTSDSNSPLASIENDVHKFIDETLKYIQSLESWLSMSPLQREIMEEGLEKYILTKIYPSVFLVNDSIEEDIKKIVNMLQMHVYLHNLGIIYDKEEFEKSWEIAEIELNRLNEFKSPRDKIICLLNCSKILQNILKTGSTENGMHENNHTDNQFDSYSYLSLLFYTIVKANVANLFSNIQYIMDYRNSHKLLGESGHCLLFFISAISILQSMPLERIRFDMNKLILDIKSTCQIIDSTLNEFKATLCSENKGKLEHYKEEAGKSFMEINTSVSLFPPLHTQGNNIELWRRERYKFIDKSVYDIKVVDIKNLLQEYKNLASSVEALLNDRQLILNSIEQNTLE